MFILRRATNWRNLSQLRFKSGDPGIRRRRDALAVEPHETEYIDFDDLESDFMQVHKSHKDHLHEMRLRKEREHYLLVKQKYFKDSQPNFLTWHDKEQIRYLHRTNPEEWTVEQLAESFPALPDTIAKIIKSNWTKTKQNKITNHDRSVQRNWNAFKQGQIDDLPPDLVEHLNKFTSRALNLKPFVLPAKDAPLQKPPAVFSDIITSYKELKQARTMNKNDTVEENKDIVDKNEQPQYVAKHAGKNEMTTLAAYKNKVLFEAQQGKEGDLDDKLIMSSCTVGVKTDKNATNQCEDVLPQKFETSTEVGIISKKPGNNLAHLDYPDRIVIPKDKVKKGCTYKLNDCYYDEDGEFLYRVPGMYQ